MDPFAFWVAWKRSLSGNQGALVCGHTLIGMTEYGFTYAGPIRCISKTGETEIPVSVQRAPVEGRGNCLHLDSTPLYATPYLVTNLNSLHAFHSAPVKLTVSSKFSHALLSEERRSVPLAGSDWVGVACIEYSGVIRRTSRIVLTGFSERHRVLSSAEEVRDPFSNDIFGVIEPVSSVDIGVGGA